MNVAHTLTVDGYIQANSKMVDSAASSLSSGGSGGSIIIHTVNITGEFRGVCKGGEGGGGGSEELRSLPAPALRLFCADWGKGGGGGEGNFFVCM